MKTKINMLDRLIIAAWLIWFIIVLFGSVMTFPIWIVVYVITGFNVSNYLDDISDKTKY